LDAQAAIAARTVAEPTGDRAPLLGRASRQFISFSSFGSLDTTFEASCAFRFAHVSNPSKTLNEQAVAPAIT